MSRRAIPEHLMKMTKDEEERLEAEREEQSRLFKENQEKRGAEARIPERSRGDDEMRVEYSSNNSGGSWWLKDEDWKALEEAGWDVQWGELEFCFSNWRGRSPVICASAEVCEGHPEYTSYEQAKKGGGFLGAVAMKASFKCETPEEAIRSFQEVTGQDPGAEGCNCCGPPHIFSWGGRGLDISWGYVSGEECYQYLWSRAYKPEA